MSLSKPRRALTAAGLWFCLQSLAPPSPWAQVVERPVALEVPAVRPRRERRSERPVWAPLPPPNQVWAHSCVSKRKLEKALQDPEVTAIEVDVAMGYLTGDKDEMVPVMAHPPILTSDLSFEEFLEQLIRDGKRHVKFDFKDLKAVERCLPLLRERSKELAANGQAVWLNADVLPGPGLRGWSCSVPAEQFLAAAEEHCPGAYLSLGWKANPVTLEAYNEADCRAMATLCRHHAKQNVVFAVAARTAARNFEPLAALLSQVPGSQLLFWTGAWEPPLPRGTLWKLREELRKNGFDQRGGFDCRVLDPRHFCGFVVSIFSFLADMGFACANAVLAQYEMR